MNEEFQQLYDYIKSQDMTDLSEQEFYDAYSNPESASELFGYISSEDMTDLNEQEFFSAYFSGGVEKKSPNGTSEEEVTESVTETETVPTGSSDSSGQGSSFSASDFVAKDTAFEQGFQSQPEQDTSEFAGVMTDRESEQQRAFKEDFDTREFTEEEQVSRDEQDVIPLSDLTPRKYTDAAGNVFEGKSIDEARKVKEIAERGRDGFIEEEKPLSAEEALDKNNFLEGIDRNFIVDNSADEIAESLRKKYSDKGFVFTTDGDILTVTSEYDKKGITLDLGVGEVFSDRGALSDISDRINPGISVIGKIARGIDYISGEASEQRDIQVDLLRNFLYDNQSISEGKSSDEVLSLMRKGRQKSVSPEEYKKYSTESTLCQVYNPHLIVQSRE